MPFIAVSFLLMLSLESLYSQPNYWQTTNAPTSLKVTSIATKIGGYTFVASEDSGLYRSSNLGQDWQRIINGLTYPDVLALAVSANGDLFAGTLGVYRSPNNGENWLPTGTLNAAAFCFKFKSPDLILVGTGGGVYRSTDNGGTWTHASNGLPNPTSIDVWALAANSNGYVFAATGGSGVFRTTDNGDNWSAANNGISNAIVSALVITPLGDLLAGTASSGAWRSTDNGDTWSQLGLSALSVSSFVANSRGHIFVGTKDAGVFSSTDGRESWVQINSGLTNANVRALGIDSSGFIFSGTDMGGIFRSVESTTSVGEAASAFVSSFVLQQNYPNPFNPGTKIRFGLPASGLVSLKVFDVLGRKAATLVNDVLAPGNHEVTLDATGLSSGVYFYRLQAGKFIQTKKLILQK